MTSTYPAGVSKQPTTDIQLHHIVYAPNAYWCALATARVHRASAISSTSSLLRLALRTLRSDVWRLSQRIDGQS